jgi:hypothetical protein
MFPGYGFEETGPLNAGEPNRHSALSGSEEWQTVELSDSHSAQDEWVLKDVKKALMNHPELNAAKVHIGVKEGMVSLAGMVESEYVKADLEGLVRSVDGVEDVVSLLRTDKNSNLNRNLSGQGQLRMNGREIDTE